MKIALYIEDGLEQIVLTPKGEAEIALLSRLHDGSREFTLYQGEFYACQGGWTRHGTSDRSTIIVMKPKSKEPPPTDVGQVCAVCGVGPFLGCLRSDCPQK